MRSVFDSRAAEYDAWYDRNKFAYLSELAALRKVVPRRGKGLEIGVGTGRFAAPLCIGTGIDPSRGMRSLAVERGVDARPGTGEDLPFSDGAFDYVVCVITLCFVKDPAKVLREAARVLVSNGRLIIGIVDRDSFLGRTYRRKKSAFYKKARFFSVGEAAGMMSGAGFGLLSYHQTLSALPGKMISVERPKKGYGKGGFVVISARKRRGK